MKAEVDGKVNSDPAYYLTRFKKTITTMEKDNIEKRYLALKQEHTKIVPVETDRLHDMQVALEQHQRERNGFIYYVATFCVIFFFATAPYVISTYYEFASQIRDDLLKVLDQKQYLRDHLYFRISCAFVLIAIPFYTLVLPFCGRWFQRQWHHFGKLKIRSMELLDAYSQAPKTTGFVIYAVLLNYFVLLIPILYLNSYKLVAQEALQILVVIWLMIPSPVLAIAPTMIMMITSVIGISYLTRRRTMARRARFHPGLIVYELMALLKDLDGSKYLEPSAWQEKIAVTERIQKISRLIRQMRWLFEGEASSHRFLRARLRAAADAFDSLVPFVALPQPDSPAVLRRAVEKMLNISLSGNYGSLPDHPFANVSSAPNDRKSGIVSRVVSFIGLVAFLSAPVVIWMVVATKFQPSLDETTKSFLTILYWGWAAAGVLAFSNTLATEIRELVVNVLRLYVGSK